MEILLVRFTKPQRAFIRKASKKTRSSEASVVRGAIEMARINQLELALSQ